MSLTIILNRCAVCGSTNVKEKDGMYTCLDCGAKRDHSMSGADLARIQRAMLVGDQEAAQKLREKYRNLNITTWSSADRLQN